MSEKILDSTQLVSGAAILLSFYVGYKYGCRINSQLVAAAAAKGNQPETTSSGGSSSAEANAYSFLDFGEYKMVLVVRNDLKMGKGKIAAQCGHGAVGAYQTALQRTPMIVKNWQDTGCAKIALKCESKDELLEIRRTAIARQLNVCMIRDAGRTQIEPNSITVLAIGPATVHDIDIVTGHLKLL